MIISQIARSIFSGDNIASTGYVYTSAASSGADDGWYISKYDHCAVQVCLATLTATSFGIRIEGRSDTYTRPAEIYSASITAAQTIDKIVNITEGVKEIRVGARAESGAVASPNNFYAGVVFTETK